MEGDSFGHDVAASPMGTARHAMGSAQCSVRMRGQVPAVASVPDPVEMRRRSSFVQLQAECSRY